MPSALLFLSVFFLLGLGLPALAIWRLFLRGEPLVPPDGSADVRAVLGAAGTALSRRVQPEHYALVVALLALEWAGFVFYLALVAAGHLERFHVVEIALVGVLLLAVLGFAWRGTILARHRRLETEGSH